MSLEELPKRVVVLGGGCVLSFFINTSTSCFLIEDHNFFSVVRYIAVEFASIWNGMGAKVDLCFRRELPLRYNIPYSMLLTDF